MIDANIDGTTEPHIHRRGLSGLYSGLCKMIAYAANSQFRQMITQKRLICGAMPR